LFKKGRGSKTEDVAKGELKYLLTRRRGRRLAGERLPLVRRDESMEMEHWIMVGWWGYDGMPHG
jgi:septum formation topological specificity factor MinE